MKSFNHRVAIQLPNSNWLSSTDTAKEVTITRTILSCKPILLMGLVGLHADVLDFNALEIGEEVKGFYNGGWGVWEPGLARTSGSLLQTIS
jgi:hypothetical protein